MKPENICFSINSKKKEDFLAHFEETNLISFWKKASKKISHFWSHHLLFNWFTVSMLEVYILHSKYYCFGIGLKTIGICLVFVYMNDWTKFFCLAKRKWNRFYLKLPTPDDTQNIKRFFNWIEKIPFKH